VDSLALLEGAYADAESPDFVERTQSVDVGTYLPDDLLVKVDIAAMCHALEARSPFLDHELATFAAQLPRQYKLRGRTAKYLLKRAMRAHLPEAILHRDKQGFGVPVGSWFRGQLRSLAEDLLLDRRTLDRGLLDGTGVSRLLAEHWSGERDQGQRIWQLVVLELWFRTYLDRPRSALTGPLGDLSVREVARSSSSALVS
jgi:asparagine synthase (glutamine-hydrolysing)